MMAEKAKKPAKRPAKASGSKRSAAGRSRIDSAVGSTKVRDRGRLSERMGSSVRTRLFAQSTVLDFLLVLVVSCGLAFTLSYGFHSAWAYRDNIWLIAGLNIPLLLAMYVGTWSKRALVPSIVATVVAAVLIVGIAAAVSPESLVVQSSDKGVFDYGSASSVADVPGNYVIFALIVVACAVVTFLLSRRTVGLFFLLLVTVIACGIIQFLYRDWIDGGPGLAATVAVLLGIGILFVYHCYKQSVYSANRVKRTSFGGAFAFSLVVATMCVLVGAGVFFGGIAAADLMTPQIKLFDKYVSPPAVESQTDFEKTDDENEGETDQTDDREQDTSADAEGGVAGRPEGIGLLENTVIADVSQLMAGSDAADNIEYLIVAWELVILGVLLALLVLAIILLWRHQRVARLKRISKRSNAYQVWYIYTFLLGRLRRMKLRKPQHLTPLEFAVGFSKSMMPFTRGTGGVDFVEVSSVYQDAVYGGIQPADEDVERVRTYYRAFFKNARSYVGWPKWLLWKYWRI